MTIRKDTSMYDSNNEEKTISRPAADMEKWSVLSRRHEAVSALAKLRSNNTAPIFMEADSKLYALYITTFPLISRQFGKSSKEYTELKILFDAPPRPATPANYLVLHKALLSMSEALDHSKLTRLDMRKSYDRTRPLKEEEDGAD